MDPEEKRLDIKAILPKGHKVPEGYKVLEQGVFRGDDGGRKIASAPIYIRGRLKNPERGETHYIVEIYDGGEKETLLVKTTGGVKAIAKAVEGAGIFLRGREVEEYLTEYLCVNWQKLVTDKAEEIELDDEVEPVYDQLLQYIKENEERFADQEWGCYSDGRRIVNIRITAMDEFLGSIGIANKTRTLRYWKSTGVLLPDSDGRHLARSVRINGQMRRVYSISILQEKQSKAEDKNDVSSEGLRVGDKVKLVDLNTGEILRFKLSENPRGKEVGDTEINTKSPMGKALLGKTSGDVVSVQGNGETEKMYRVG